VNESGETVSEEKKRGSKGGETRAKNLSEERRKEIARNASAARWSKVRKQAVEAKPEPDPEPVKAVPEPPPAPVKKPAKVKMRPEFGKAYAVAQKRLDAALKERAQALQVLAALKDEIPGLVQVIKALGGTVNPTLARHGTVQDFDEFQRENGGAPTPYDPANPLHNPAAMALPAIPVARSGAIGGVIPDEKQEDPDIFLKQAEQDMANKGWM